MWALDNSLLCSICQNTQSESAWLGIFHDYRIWEDKNVNLGKGWQLLFSSSLSLVSRASSLSKRKKEMTVTQATLDPPLTSPRETKMGISWRHFESWSDFVSLCRCWFHSCWNLDNWAKPSKRYWNYVRFVIEMFMLFNKWCWWVSSSSSSLPSP